jgi:predicted anti-sigma-YlaC factor YlaD
VRNEHLSDAELQSTADRGRTGSGFRADHLAECPTCRETAARYSRLFDGLAAAEPRFSLPASFFTSVLAKTEPLQPGREPMPWASGLALSGAAVAAAAVYAIWLPERLRNAAAEGMRLLDAALRTGSDWIADAAHAFPPEPDGYARWLMASLAAVAFAAVSDAFLRRFRQVPVDKHG